MSISILVTSVKFAHDDKSRLACCSYDGKISICQVIPSPSTVICILEGHTSGVTGQIPPFMHLSNYFGLTIYFEVFIILCIFYHVIDQSTLKVSSKKFAEVYEIRWKFLR